VSFFLPLVRRLFRTFLPFFVLILFLKPCSFFLCRTFGWYVIFMTELRLLLLNNPYNRADFAPRLNFNAGDSTPGKR
jgi:hypothetical protein